MSSVAVFSKASPFDALQRWLPKLVLAPSMFIVLVGFYGYILWTFVLSFTNSTFLPTYKFVGLAQYARLFDNDRWWVASKNLAVFGGMFIGITLVIGVTMAMFLAGLRGVDQSIIRAAQIDGASMPRIYWKVVLPSLRPVFFSAVMILAHIAIKSFRSEE